MRANQIRVLSFSSQFLNYLLVILVMLKNFYEWDLEIWALAFLEFI
jgi:hypothetical protein